MENLCLMFRFLENYRIKCKAYDLYPLFRHIFAHGLITFYDDLWWFSGGLGCFYDDSWWFMMLYPLPLSHYIFTHGFERILKVLLLKLLTSAPLIIRSNIIIIHHLFQLLKSLEIEKPQLVGLWAFCCHSSSFFNTFSNLQWKDYLFANLLHEI